MGRQAAGILLIPLMIFGQGLDPTTTSKSFSNSLARSSLMSPRADEKYQAKAPNNAARPMDVTAIKPVQYDQNSKVEALIDLRLVAVVFAILCYVVATIFVLTIMWKRYRRKQKEYDRR